MELPEGIIDILNTESDVASGQHMPASTMWSVPNDISEEPEEEEEELSKQALGLTSVPSSLYGGELLEHAGVPEQPGLKRDEDDEEPGQIRRKVNLFGDEATIPDELPPANNSSSEEQEFPEDINFFDFLYENVEKKAYLKNLDSLETFLVNNEYIREANKTGELVGIILKKGAPIHFMKGNQMDKISKRIDSRLTEIFKRAQTQKTPAWHANRENWQVDVGREDYAELGKRIWTDWQKTNPAPATHKFAYEIAQWFLGSGWLSENRMITPTNISAAIKGQFGQKAQPQELIDRAAMICAQYASEKLQEKKPEIGIPGGHDQPSDKIPSRGLTGWEGYIAKTGPIGEQVRAAWQKFNPAGSYQDWVQWYLALSKGEGREFSPQEVIDILSGSEGVGQAVEEIQQERQVKPPPGVPEAPPGVPEATTPEQPEVPGTEAGETGEGESIYLTPETIGNLSRILKLDEETLRREVGKTARVVKETEGPDGPIALIDLGNSVADTPIPADVRYGGARYDENLQAWKMGPLSRQEIRALRQAGLKGKENRTERRELRRERRRHRKEPIEQRRRERIQRTQEREARPIAAPIEKNANRTKRLQELDKLLKTTQK